MLCSSFIAKAQHSDADELIKNSMEGLRIPGLSLAIVKNGKVVKKGGYGWANLELKVPSSPQTAYEIGSISKSFTAIV